MVINKLQYYYRGDYMYRDRITLSSQEILEKDFKIDARGYRMQEVDKYLDIIIKDYNEYNNIVRELAVQNNQLHEENEKLKQEVRSLHSNLEAFKYSEKEVTNVDLIKRVSQLEKRVSQLEKIILGAQGN
jgi:DivIVA domain-containing protein